MPITMTLDGVGTGLRGAFGEDGFTVSTNFTPADQSFWANARPIAGAIDYLSNQNSTDPVIVRQDDGNTFGAFSIKLNGFGSKLSDGSNSLDGTSQVTFTFTGVQVRPDGSTQYLTFSHTTDLLNTFELVTLPPEFGYGLSELSWQTGGDISVSTGWGYFDDIVLQPNRAPTTSGFTGATDQDTALTGQLTAGDADSGQPYIFTPAAGLPTGVTLNTNGTFTVNALSSYKSLGLGETQVVRFDYRATDGHGSGLGTFSVTITGKNDAPSAQADTSFRVSQNGVSTLDVLANDTDVDTADVLSVLSVGATANGGRAFIDANGKLQYEPGAAFKYLGPDQPATDTFTYTVSDGKGGTSTATVTVTIIGENDAPVAGADTASVTELASVTIDVLANDRDPDAGDSVQLAGVGAPGMVNGLSAKGATISIVGGKIVYVADALEFELLGGGESTTDTFTYWAMDTNGVMSSATVTMTVNGMAAASVAICGTPKPDYLVGTNADETICGLAKDDVIYGYGGADVLYGDEHSDQLYGGLGRDLLYGGKHDDLLYGEEGADTLVGGDHRDQLFGGDDDDALYGGDQEDTLNGDAGNDTLSGGDHSDELFGGDGEDLLFGDDHDDLLIGGNGNDTLSGGDGKDDLYGGYGDDVINGDGGSYEHDDYDDDGHLDNDSGGGGDDDTLDGQEGNDTLNGGDGNDWVIGGDGNDSLTGGKDTDLLEGGAGNDTLAGSEGRDTLRGGDGADNLDGGSDNDTLEGGAGMDRLLGGDGADRLLGGTEFDFLSGGAGNDYLEGGSGNDTLSGGTGGDRFYFGAGFGKDVITDFNVLEDQIQFSKSIFSSYSKVMAVASQVGTDVVITVDSSNTLTLKSMNLSALKSDDFLFG